MSLKTKITPLGASNSFYVNGEVVFESDVAGTYDVELLSAPFLKIFVIGAGGGAAGTKSSNSCAASAGASGSGFVGCVKLPKGKVTVVVGKGGLAQCWLDGTCNGETGGASMIKSAEETLVFSPGGGGGHTWWRSGASPASLGALPTINVEVVEEELNRQGNSGTNYNSGPGGASIIADSTYGKGGHNSGWSSNVEAFPGSDGYVKIEYVSRR